MCRDRVGGSTENAIQLAHTDNHCAKAVEMQLCMAKQQGAVGSCTGGIPLAVTLADVRDYNARRGSTQPQKTRNQILGEESSHTAGGGDATVFLGKKLTWRSNHSQEVHNAVGFFMYTTCKQNTLGSWPERVGALPAVL
jgi:hypothetical protein